jgi:hypothetical protein
LSTREETKTSQLRKSVLNNTDHSYSRLSFLTSKSINNVTNIHTIWDYFYRTVKRAPNNLYFGTRKYLVYDRNNDDDEEAKSNYEWITYAQAFEEIKLLCLGLHSFNSKEYDERR